KLSPFNVNIFLLFPADILHEIELGVWKAIYMRILRCQGQALIDEFDRHFRNVPSFGRDTIRKFSTNSSEIKRMAA
ncbi:hypothetical protein SERLA73DRAFT_44832, partial [Serpula lacrymans var. lacrymans S7.3]